MHLFGIIVLKILLFTEKYKTKKNTLENYLKTDTNETG